MKSLLLQEMRTHSDETDNTWNRMRCYEVSGPYSKSLLGMPHQNGKNYGHFGGLGALFKRTEEKGSQFD
jgi:hypothetical protein